MPLRPARAFCCLRGWKERGWKEGTCANNCFFIQYLKTAVCKHSSVSSPDAQEIHHGERVGLGIGGSGVLVGLAAPCGDGRTHQIGPAWRLGAGGGSGCGASCARWSLAQPPPACGVAADRRAGGRCRDGCSLGGHDPWPDVAGGGRWLLTPECHIIACLSHPLSRPQFHPMPRT